MANPVVRDFNSNSHESGRARAATQTTPSSTPFPIDIEPNVGRHNTLSPPTRQDSEVSLPGLQRRITRSNTIRNYHSDARVPQPGAEPGIDPLREAISNFSLVQQPCQITLVDFNEEKILRHEFDNEELIKFIKQPREDWVACRWINVNGLSWDVIRALGAEQKLHRLAIEDLLSTGGRTKADFYRDHCFILLTLQKLIRLKREHDDDGFSISSSKRKRWWSRFRGQPDPTNYRENVDGASLSPKEKSIPSSYVLDSMLPIGENTRTLQRYRRTVNPERALFMERNSALTKRGMAVSVEQVSVFLTQNQTVISLFEHSADDIEKPILKRLESGDTILRRSEDGSMMLQAVIDAIVDLAMPVTAAYEDIIGELELDVLTDPSIERSRQLYILTSELSLLRSNMQPIANVLSALRDHGRTDTNPPTNEAAQNQDQHPDGVPATMPPKKPVKSITISPLGVLYFGDVEDNVVLLTQQLDIMRRTTNDMIDLTYNQMSAFQNESMKQLTAVTIFFLPLTFLTGYFGQNFHDFASLDNSDAFFWKIAIPVCAAVALFLMGPLLQRNLKKMFQRLWINRARKARKERGG